MTVEGAAETGFVGGDACSDAKYAVMSACNAGSAAAAAVAAGAALRVPDCDTTDDACTRSIVLRWLAAVPAAVEADFLRPAPAAAPRAEEDPEVDAAAVSTMPVSDGRAVESKRRSGDTCARRVVEAEEDADAWWSTDAAVTMPCSCKRGACSATVCSSCGDRMRLNECSSAACSAASARSRAETNDDSSVEDTGTRRPLEAELVRGTCTDDSTEDALAPALDSCDTRRCGGGETLR